MSSTATATWYFVTHVVRCRNDDIGSTHGSVWNPVTHTGSTFHAFLFS
ncbi:hypothetical protein PC123_g28131 [Phytophthora cactorum]|nr:hypothetical protein PC123_g28131 [Phytophthora cactorum]